MLSETDKHIQYNNNSFNQLLLISNKKQFLHFEPVDISTFPCLVQIQMLVLYWSQYESLTTKTEIQGTNCPCRYQTFSLLQLEALFSEHFHFWLKFSTFFNICFEPKWPCTQPNQKFWVWHGSWYLGWSCICGTSQHTDSQPPTCSNA